MGIDLKRFVDLSEGLAKHLICGICHNILDNSVITSCGHSFCELCVKQSIDSNYKSCPECRKKLKKRSSSGEGEDDPTVMIGDYCFARNFKINGIISELTIKCEFDFNGCQQTAQLGLILDHLKVCPNRLCKVCGFIAERSPLHNCFELMKKDRDHWKRKFIKADEENLGLKNRVQVLQEVHAYCDFQDIVTEIG